MRDPVFYFARFRHGFPAAALAEDRAALTDLGLVAGVNQAQATDICERLARAEGFLDPKGVAAIVREVVSEDQVARAVQRVLRNLEPGNIKPLLDALSERRTNPDFPLNEDALKDLRQALDILIQPYPAIERFKKAERLSELTGQQLESLELICDLRPIFDAKRERLEGMMPITRLRILASGADGLPQAFEVELTLEQAHDLVEKATKAKNKLQVLRGSIETWLPGGLPELPLTRARRLESEDA